MSSVLDSVLSICLEVRMIPKVAFLQYTGMFLHYYQIILSLENIDGIHQHPWHMVVLVHYLAHIPSHQKLEFSYILLMF